MNAGIVAQGPAAFSMPQSLLGLSQPVPSIYGRAGDPHWRSVSLLLRMEGPHRGRTFTDLSQYRHVVTPIGDSFTSGVRGYYGGSSAFFDGTGDYLSIPANSTAFAFGTGDLTVEAWVYPTSYNAQDLRIFSTAGGFSNFSFGAGQNALPGFWDGGTYRTFGSNNSMPINRWSHLAFTRSSGVFRAFVNGIVVGNPTNITTNLVNTQTVMFPASSSYGSSVGFLNDLRVTKGVARYVSNFAIPTQPYPNF